MTELQNTTGSTVPPHKGTAAPGVALLTEGVEKFATALRGKGKQPATVESYRRDAARFVQYLIDHRIPTGNVSPEIMLSYQDFLRYECGERENTIRRAVIGVRQFYRFLHEGQVTAGSPLDAALIPPRDESLGTIPDAEDIQDILTVAAAGRPAAKAARDVALVTLLALEGVKATEAINLKWHDFIDTRSQTGSAVETGSRNAVASLHINGARERVVSLGEAAANALRTWRTHYQMNIATILRAGNDAKIFVSFKGRDAGTVTPDISRHGLKFIMYELGEKSGFKQLNTEALRHYAVSYLLAEGWTPESIMRHLGLRRLGNIAKHLMK